MNKILTAILGVLSFVGFIALIGFGLKQCGTPMSDEPLVVGLLPCTPPYTFGSSEAYNGFDFDLAQLLGRKFNQNVKIKRISIAGFASALSDETVDIIASSMIITDKRLKDMAMIHVYGRPYPYMTFVFWEQGYKDLIKDAKHIKELFEFFEKRHVGIVRGAIWEQELRKYGITRIKTYPREYEAINALKQGDVAACVLGMLSADFLEKQNSNVWTLEVALDKPYGYGVGVSLNKDRKDLIRQVADAIQELKDEGMITMLQLRWFGKTF